MKRPSKSVFALSLRRRAVTLSAAMVVGVATILPLGASMAADAEGTVPDFNSSGFGWHSRTVANLPPPPGTPGEHGPIGDHPDHPHFSNNSGRTPTPRIGNDLHPLLQPWAAERIRVANEAIHAGGTRFQAQGRCWPPGVPNILNYTAEPMLFLQNPDEVTMIYQRGQVVRHIFLNEEHPEDLAPTWMGHSIGHYEGDTLVIDTVAIDSRSLLDEFGTPHTDQLHVIERYRIVRGSPDLITNDPIPVDPYFANPENEVLHVIAWIEDPGTFTAPYTVMQLYERATNRFEESICAENSFDRFNQGLVPVPTDQTPDF